MSNLNNKIPVDDYSFGLLTGGVHYNPHGILGAHFEYEYRDHTTIRVFKPFAQKVVIRTVDGEFEAEHEKDGVFTVVLDSKRDENNNPIYPDYRVKVTYDGYETEMDDPYRFSPMIGELDQHLIGEGRHEELWKVLGANVKEFYSELGDVKGTSFSVWAPNAKAVRIKGDFNYWNGEGHQMRSLGASGVWELFVPGVETGAQYKFEILNNNGGWFEKCDPVAKYAQIPPETASVVFESKFDWSDNNWEDTKKKINPHTQPISVYELHLGSWRKGLSYNELADQLVEYIKEMNFTHVEFMPVAQHPFEPSWGYQVTGYFAINSRFGNPDEFKHLVNTLHNNGIGVIVDWVPAHFPKDEFALANFDGTPLYEDPNPLRGEHPDWGTKIFNFGRKEVRNFLVANACYWFEDFHIDALRVDAVASMLYLDYSREDGQWQANQYGGNENLEAIDFLQETTATVYKRYPGIMMIAEESTSWQGVTAPTSVGGLGFGLKWNMGWMNDTLEYFKHEPVHRSYHHGEITFSMVYAFSENFILPLSHDEVVHGKGSLIDKMPGDKWQKLANLRLLYSYQWTHPGKNLIFMGCEFGQWGEWTEANSIDWGTMEDWDHKGVWNMLKDLNQIYRTEKSLYELDHDSRGFEWLDINDSEHSVLSFVRKDEQGNPVVVVINFANAAFEGYRIALPNVGGAHSETTKWKEIFNSDNEYYGGSNVVNPDEITAEDFEYHGRNYSLSLRVPPLGVTILKPV
ncbi:MAG: 1,4-alpha-glucan branching protein GlgB [Bifidobacteriaceae bacterium]|jgi:1,4-alpha-glucan branching enzyme|nr:1,4-alpha-glucan branching protein GlgB [Bifidobacteriaceae bacterium]